MAESPAAREPQSPWAADPWTVLPWNRHWPVLHPSVGRRLRWRWGRGPVSFRLESLSIVPGWVGRLRSVRATVAEVELDPDPGGVGNPVRLDEVHIAARNIRVRPSAIQLERVELRVYLGQAGLDAMLVGGMPYASLQLTDGMGLARLASRPGWGYIELVPSVGDGGLVLSPTALVTGGTRWTAPARLLPRLRIGADVLLPGSQLLSVTVVEDRLLLTAELSDLTLPLLTRADEEVVVDLNDATTDNAVTVELPGRAEPVIAVEPTGRDGA